MTVALCMIVRDEADVIARCIQSCRRLIDYWIVCDTGSSDDPLAVVRRELVGVPGELHERPGVDFGHNRGG